jgi:hypothetical protein
MGKTAILKRLYNKLFTEQDRVIPIYIDLEKIPKYLDSFSIEYLGMCVQQYLAFKYKRYDLLKVTDYNIPNFEYIISEALGYKDDMVSEFFAHCGRPYETDLNGWFTLALGFPRAMYENQGGSFCCDA